MKFELTISKGLPAKFNKMFVVREKEYLSPLGQTRELREDRLGALVVEGDQQVIENEGHGLVDLQVAIECCEPERKVELVAGAITQTLDRDLGLIWSDTHEDGDIIRIEFRAQPVECSAGEGLEDLTGLL